MFFQKIEAAMSIASASWMASTKPGLDGEQPITSKHKVCAEHPVCMPADARKAPRREAQRGQREMACTVALRTLLPQKMQRWNLARLRRPLSSRKHARPARSRHQPLTHNNADQGSSKDRIEDSSCEGAHWNRVYGTCALCLAATHTNLSWPCAHNLSSTRRLYES